jgi:hypothetical protein
MSTTKLTGRENLAKYRYAFWLGPVGPTDKENQVKLFKKYCFRYIILFEMAGIRIWIRIKQSDPNPYQIEKQDPDPYKGLDPQHCLKHPVNFSFLLKHKQSGQIR